MNFTSTIEPEKTRPMGTSIPILWVIGTLLAICMAFMWIQNSITAIGGPISLAKALWLDCTLTIFFVVPFYLWKNNALSRKIQFLFGCIFTSFVIRGIVEIIIIYGTHAWRCGYGITHDYITLLLAILLLFRFRRDLSATDKRALIFLPIYGATLVFESINAWQFSLLINPATGIYFADNSPHFTFLNHLTWLELGCLWPFLSYFLWKFRFDFLRS